jgi:uncharacterized membrane protein YccC
MAENGEKKLQKVVEGIQYLIGDNKHLREELKEFSRQAAEDRKQAAEDRRRSDERFERMMEKAEEDRGRSDERFSLVLDQVKRTNRVAVEIARGIRRELQELRDGQRQANRLLGEIVKRLPPGSNGK